MNEIGRKGDKSAFLAKEQTTSNRDGASTTRVPTNRRTPRHKFVRNSTVAAEKASCRRRGDALCELAEKRLDGSHIHIRPCCHLIATHAFSARAFRASTFGRTNTSVVRGRWQSSFRAPHRRHQTTRPPPRARLFDACFCVRVEFIMFCASQFLPFPRKREVSLRAPPQHPSACVRGTL